MHAIVLLRVRTLMLAHTWTHACMCKHAFRDCTCMHAFRDCTCMQIFRDCTRMDAFRDCTCMQAFRDCTCMHVRAFIRTRLRCVYACTGSTIHKKKRTAQPPPPRDSGGCLEAHLFKKVGTGAHLSKNRFQYDSSFL